MHITDIEKDLLTLKYLKKLTEMFEEMHGKSSILRSSIELIEKLMEKNEKYHACYRDHDKHRQQ